MIHFHEFLASSKLGILTSNCDIVVDLYYPLADPADEFKITMCRSRHFCGSMQVYDEKNESELMVRAAIDYNDDIGEFTFEPVTNFVLNQMSEPANNVYEVGILPTTIIIDELYDGMTEEEVKELVPEEDLPDVPDVDLDYESDREADIHDPIEDDDDPKDTPDEEESKQFQITAKCGAWVNGGTGVSGLITFWKNTKTKKGRIRLHSYMKQSLRGVPYPTLK